MHLIQLIRHCQKEMHCYMAFVMQLLYHWDILQD